MLRDEQRREHQRNRRQQLHEDVQRRAGGVLEGVAHGVAHDSCGVGHGALADDVAVLVLEVTRLDVLLGVVPRAATVVEDGREQDAGWLAVSGLLIVGTIAGIMMATVLNNSGGAWDNAKKFIEAGGMKDEHGNVLGKGSPTHAAAVVGDTVGDPFKDTAGPSLHVLVKLLATITLVMAPLFV